MDQGCPDHSEAMAQMRKSTQVDNDQRAIDYLGINSKRRVRLDPPPKQFVVALPRANIHLK
jgi:hypothetical protein